MLFSLTDEVPKFVSSQLFPNRSWTLKIMRPTNALKCKLSFTNHHPNDNFDTYMDGLQNRPTGHRPGGSWVHRSLETEPLCEVISKILNIHFEVVTRMSPS